ncbi:MAG: SLATT domain-containing protein [Chloroflexi bacterium]|nr:SLATT domain-containing protein [Chloroflexota bacterium]
MTDVSDPKAAMAAEASRLEEDCLYSARGHLEATRIQGWINMALGLPGILVAAYASRAAIRADNTAAAVLAGLVAALTALHTFLNPSEQGAKHHAAGTQFLALRRDFRMFREIDLAMGTDLLIL